MAGLVKVNSGLPAQIPGGQFPEDIYRAFNDVYLAIFNLTEQLNAATPVMMSPNGHFWKATISNAGVVTWTDVGTVRP